MLLAGCGAQSPDDLLKIKSPELVVRYHPNGVRAEECSYLSGKRHGLCMTWDIEGRLLTEGRYSGDLPEGTHFIRTREGEIFRDYQNGMLHGRCTLITRENVTVDTPFRHGLAHGRLEAIGPNGITLGEMYFEYGELHGRSVLWHNDGTLMESGYFENGRAQGFWSFWNRKGELSSEGSFADGQRHGYWVFFRCCDLPPEETFCDRNQPSPECSSSWLPMAKMAPETIVRLCSR